MATVLYTALLLASAGARADLWGYVDDAGAAHFASERIDDRYQLFFKGRLAADTPTPPDAAAAAAADAREAFRRTPIQRMTAHPNVARFDALIARHAQAQRLEPALVKALIAVESAFEPSAVSARGALGLMQVIPDTGRRYGVNGDRRRTLEQKLLDPEINVGVGTRYLHDLLVLFGGDLSLALAGYNAGEAAVTRHANRVPPYPETEDYVKLVQQFQSLYRPPAPPPAAVRPIATPGQRRMPSMPRAATPPVDANAAAR